MARRHYPTKFAAIYRELAARGLPTQPGPFRRAHRGGATTAGSCSRPTGIVEGEIAPEPRGAHGFGYDPIFFYPPYGCTLAEVEGAKKAAVSHRGKAFRQLRDWLSLPTLPRLRPI